MKLSLRVNQRQVDEARTYLGDVGAGVKGAITAAINRVLDQTLTIVSRETRRVYVVSDKAVKKASTTRKASVKSGLFTGLLSITGRPLALFAFSPRPNTPQAKRPPVGASVQVRRTSPRFKKPGAFIADMDSGHRGVFRRVRGVMNRKGTGEKIAEQFGVSIPGAVGVPDVWENIEAQAQAKLDDRVSYELDRLLKSGK